MNITSYYIPSEVSDLAAVLGFQLKVKSVSLDYPFDAPSQLVCIAARDDLGAHRFYTFQALSEFLDRCAAADDAAFELAWSSFETAV